MSKTAQFDFLGTRKASDIGTILSIADAGDVDTDYDTQVGSIVSLPRGVVQVVAHVTLGSVVGAVAGARLKLQMRTAPAEVTNANAAIATTYATSTVQQGAYDGDPAENILIKSWASGSVSGNVNAAFSETGAIGAQSILFPRIVFMVASVTQLFDSGTIDIPEISMWGYK